MLQKVLWDPKLNGFSSNLLKTLLRNSSEALSLDENATQGFLLACSSLLDPDPGSTSYTGFHDEIKTPLQNAG